MTRFRITGTGRNRIMRRKKGGGPARRRAEMALEWFSQEKIEALRWARDHGRAQANPSCPPLVRKIVAEYRSLKGLT